MPKKKKRAWLICNPGAGNSAEFTARLEQVTSLLQDLGFRLKVTMAHPKAKATPVARRAAKKGYPLVIALGGDGTIEAISRGLVGSKTRLGIIPGGTANNIAKSLCIPEDIESACRLLVDGVQRKLDAGRLRTKKEDFYFFEIATLGLAAELYPESTDLGKGQLGKLPSILRSLVGYQVPKFTLKLDGDSVVREHSLLFMAANTPQWGLNFRAAPNASVRDGLLDLSIYPGFSKGDLVAYFARIAKGGSADDSQVMRFRAKKASIKARPKQRIMADGVMLGKGKVKIRLLPGALRVIVPEQVPPAMEKPESESLPAPVSPAQAEGG
jgi:diacylglycerol kinase (ATP)